MKGSMGGAEEGAGGSAMQVSSGMCIRGADAIPKMPPGFQLAYLARGRRYFSAEKNIGCRQACEGEVAFKQDSVQRAPA